MFKRTIWFTVGAAAGLGSSVWVQRRVRQAVDALPERVQREVTDTARRVGGDVRAAATEGRQAMSDRHRELRTELDQRAPRRTHHQGAHAAEPAPPGSPPRR